ncbi:tRNA-dihydrouridine(20a/20b) synthase [NAD(P)+]-like [Ornithodoros turicata]|uniref:tRNA-dihydrouridine(20a/20b) synthase [NAD(P)+]-like n=1 Tax=Ornithodoros turicata TaxID=34597 RepID=UPI003138D388
MESEAKDNCYMKPLELLCGRDLVKICAPMVRYSKLPFRMLVRKYAVDVAYTPMIMSDSFVKSQKARDAEFTTGPGDRPLVVQFAANNAIDLANASELIFKHADGVDLNCGCPQRWAMAEGYGACLIEKPELVRDLIHQTRNRIADPDFTVSMKIRIHKDIRRTVDLCRKVESCGLSFLTVHGRTKEQRSEPVDLEAIRIIKESLDIPVVANGDVNSVERAQEVARITGVDGVMAARSLLENPAMFSGAKFTPACCVQDWLDLSASLGCHFTPFHHHLMFMLDHALPRTEKRIFNVLSSTSAVLDYLHSVYSFQSSSDIVHKFWTLDCGGDGN